MSLVTYDAINETVQNQQKVDIMFLKLYASQL